MVKFLKRSARVHIVFRDKHCNINATDPKEFERFQNVREITGYLAIEEWKETDLCIFKYVYKLLF